tara:strand:+ start:2577 stop:3872 length:1296 start_codon:yes stop_codon:yes gene_type:complete
MKSDNWATIGEVAEVFDGPHATPKKIDEGPYFLSISSLDNGKLDLSKSAHLSEEQYIKWTKRVTPQEGDLLFSYETRLGEAALMPPNIKSCLGRRMGLLRLDRKKVIPKYLLYVYLSPEFQSTIEQRKVHGCTVDRISLTELPSFPIRLPPLPEQKNIAHILGSLDDKIELNRRMNATLEGMAQALFQSWFVDFDPVLDNALAAGNPIPDELADRAAVRRQALANGTANRAAAKPFPAAFHLSEEMGWIPEGWEALKLSDLLEVKYGKDHKKLDAGTVPVYGSGGLMRHANESLYMGESVLIPRKGTLNNILYLNEEFWTVDTMFYTIPKRNNVAKYTFHLLKKLDFTSMNVGSAVPSMTTKVLNALPVLLPDESALQKFDSILTSYISKNEANNSQSMSLSKLRDTLLPKLISGELRIDDAEKLAEEALA